MNFSILISFSIAIIITFLSILTANVCYKHIKTNFCNKNKEKCKKNIKNVIINIHNKTFYIKIFLTFIFLLSTIFIKKKIINNSLFIAGIFILSNTLYSEWKYVPDNILFCVLIFYLVFFMGIMILYDNGIRKLKHILKLF